MKMLWLILVPISTMLMGYFPQKNGWRLQIEKALYEADRSETVILDGGVEAIAADTIKNLSETLAPLIAFTGEIPTEIAMEAALALATYRRHFSEQHGKTLRDWDPEKISFFMAIPNSQGNHEHYLGYGHKVLRPGEPFADGVLVNFSRDRFWFKNEGGQIFEEKFSQLPVDPSRNVDAGEAYVVARVKRESQVFNAIAGAIGQSGIYIGDPKPLEGEFYAPQAMEILRKVARSRGAILQAESDRIFVFDSQESMESYDELEGNDLMVKSTGQLPSLEELQETVDQAMKLSEHGMNAYYQVVQEFAAKLVRDDEKVQDFANQLLEASLENEGKSNPDPMKTASFLNKTLHWFEYESDQQEAIVYQRIEDALRDIAAQGGLKGERALFLANILAE